MIKAPPIAAAYQSLVSRGRLQPNAGQVALVNQLGRLQQALIEKFSSRWTSRQPSQNGVYIYGGVGTGKSRIADLFASTLPHEVTSRRIHFHEFMVDVHTRLHAARSKSTYAGDPLVGLGREIQSQFPVLCFDEFQVSDIADAMILKRLFGSFWESGGVMVATSNRHPTELYMDGLNRPLFIPFINELQRRCLVWKMEGEHDYRMSTDQRDRMQVFFTDRTEFDKSVTQVTDGKSLHPTTIKVAMNRSVTVHATAPAPSTAKYSQASSKVVVCDTFSTLCKASLGTSDYHAICNYAHTIFLTDLRKFAADQLDYVRRFITLIDIAYEYRTRVVCLSRIPLTELFENIGIATRAPVKVDKLDDGAIGSVLTVKGEGGSSSSMMSTFINNVEWSATGLAKASLATGGAGETDVRFAVGRALSRLSEMGSVGYGSNDNC